MTPTIGRQTLARAGTLLSEQATVLASGPDSVPRSLPGVLQALQEVVGAMALVEAEPFDTLAHLEEKHRPASGVARAPWCTACSAAADYPQSVSGPCIVVSMIQRAREEVTNEHRLALALDHTHDYLPDRLVALVMETVADALPKVETSEAYEQRVARVAADLRHRDIVQQVRNVIGEAARQG